MNPYSERLEDMRQDTKMFLESELGMHIMETLKTKLEGHLSNASDVSTEHPERHIAKYSAVKEIIEFIQSPLDDHTPTHG